jgi:hypothetical protein
MKAKETIEKLRLIFNELVKSAEVPSATPTTPSAVPAEVPEMNAPIKVKTKDGVEVEITELQVGAIVTIGGTPAPIGELVLEDGTTLTIGDNGSITDIKNADGTTPTMEEDLGRALVNKMSDDEFSQKFSSFETSTNEKFASYESKFADYEQKFASYEAKLNKAYGVIEGLLNLTQTLAETPTGVADASVKTTNNFKKEKSESFDILFN